MLSIATWAVENYPYRSDYLWVTVPDHADWLYQTGEQATIEVQFYKYGIPRDGVVEYGIGTDLMEDDTKGKAELKNGRCTIKMGTANQECQARIVPRGVDTAGSWREAHQGTGLA